MCAFLVMSCTGSTLHRVPFYLCLSVSVFIIQFPTHYIDCLLLQRWKLLDIYRAAALI